MKDFPFSISTQEKSRLGKGNFHLHPFNVELQFIRSGKGFYFIKDRRFPLEGSSMLIIHDHDIHSFIPTVPPSIVCKTTIAFSLSLFNDHSRGLQKLGQELAACRGKNSHQVFFDDRSATEIELAINLLEEEWRKKAANYRESILGLLARLFVLIKRAALSQTKESKRRSPSFHLLIKRVTRYVDKHYIHPITLKEIAESMNVSFYHLSHLFSQHTGFSFKNYLAHKRVATAKRILETSNAEQISSVAYDAGFGDLRTFNRAFKRIIGMTPSNFRKLCPSSRK